MCLFVVRWRSVNVLVVTERQAPFLEESFHISNLRRLCAVCQGPLAVSLSTELELAGSSARGSP